MTKKRLSIKNHWQEIQLTTQRVALAVIIVFGLTMTLWIRLFFLQVIDHQKYSDLSTQNWLALVPIEPARGIIFDRNGVELVQNVPVFSLDITPYQVPQLNEALRSIQRIISINDDELNAFLKQSAARRYEEIPLKIRLTEREVALFTENQHRFKGMRIKARLMRFYPYGERLSHALGYIGRISAQEQNTIDENNYRGSYYIGKQGIEKVYESLLHGETGFQHVENNASGKPIRVLNEVNAVSGKNIYLTIDSRLQFAAEDALNNKRGAIVALDPRNGEILAMVSNPGFNPNAFVLGISKNDYNALLHSKDRPLYNRALRGLYPIASPIKPFLALLGLETGYITPEYTIQDNGQFKLKNSAHIFHDHVKRGHGSVNLNRAIASSCDIYFYELGTRLGIHRIAHQLHQFGFGEPTGVDLDNELAGNVPTPDWKRRVKKTKWYDGDTVVVSIGQGYLQTTPLQLAQAVSQLAAQGTRHVPHILHRIQDGHSKPYFPAKKPPSKIIKIHPEHWNHVIDGMKNVTGSPFGTAYQRFRNRKIPYTVAGKTGTAQVYSKKWTGHDEDERYVPEALRNHSLFVAFAPVENPVIALAVIVENDRAAGDTARAILDFYFENLHHESTS